MAHLDWMIGFTSAANALLVTVLQSKEEPPPPPPLSLLLQDKITRVEETHTSK
jgi:hypothetical protein